VTTRIPANPETQFNRSAWLILSITLALTVYNIANFTYRFTLPTDGWEVNEGSNPPGLTYTKNLMGNPSHLQPGDYVTAVEGIPADSQIMPLWPILQESWRAGATLDYTVIRDGQEIHIPVTLVHWQIGKWLQATLLDPVQLAGLLSGYVLLALAAFVFLRRPGNPAAGAFLIMMAIMAAFTLGGTLPGGFPNWIDPLANVLQNYVDWYSLLALFPFAIIRFALVFPRPKPIHQRNPWLSFAALAIGLILIVFTSDSPIGFYWFVFSLFLTVAILIHNAFTMRDAVSRAQLRWGLGGLIIGFGTLALMFLAGSSGWIESNPDFLDLMFAFATTVMGGMTAVAILRYRLFDIDVIIRRTLVYTVLTAILALVYFGLVILLEGALRTLVESSGQVVTVISTLTIAALFNPLRHRIQDFIDRRFYRRKYDAVHALASFSETSRREVELQSLTGALLGVVDESMQPAHLSLWIRDTWIDKGGKRSPDSKPINS
jgi:hypothetical protein